MAVEHRLPDGRTLFADVSFRVGDGAKIALVGPNGAGKTTLLRMVAGELPQSAGEITLGYGVRAGYYAQHHADTLHPADTLYATVAREKPDAPVSRIRGVLGAFLFSGDDVDKKVGVLSGGERSRVALARLLINPGNLLLMDEPTNHLDLDSSEALAESLESYDGTLVFVSHNRSFLRRLATRIWNVEAGKVDTYPGTLDEYMDSCRRRLVEGDSGKGDERAKPALKAAAVPRPEPRANREDDKARKQREHEARQARSQEKKLTSLVERLEQEIATLEAAQAERSGQLADPAVYADKTRSQTLIEKFRDAQKQLEQLQARWESALTELEKMRAAAGSA